MQKKILLLIFTILPLCGCGIDYEWDTKLIIEGRVTTPEGQPLQEILVNTYIVQDGTWPTLWGGGNGNEDKISETYTDANGYYRMMFPRPENEDI